ncbi:MAG: LemA family protein [Acidobacteriota bacterium]
MSRNLKIGCIVVGVIVLIFALSAYAYVKNTYNGFVSMDEAINQTWAQVQNQYQRRYDLIPNIVETVKGYADFEQETLTAVTEARSRVGGVTQLQADDLTPEKLQQFQQAQAGLSGALQRLMVVVERYPDLKANQSFIRLQDELAGTENRIAIERQRFNQAVQAYNAKIRQFPANMLANMFGFTQKAYFEAAQGAEQAPKVQF